MVINKKTAEHKIFDMNKNKQISYFFFETVLLNQSNPS